MEAQIVESLKQQIQAADAKLNELDAARRVIKNDLSRLTRALDILEGRKRQTTRGGRTKFWVDERVEKLKDLILGGMKISQVATEIGVTEKSVRVAASRHRISLKPSLAA